MYLLSNILILITLKHNLFGVLNEKNAPLAGSVLGGTGIKLLIDVDAAFYGFFFFLLGNGDRQHAAFEFGGDAVFVNLANIVTAAGAYASFAADIALFLLFFFGAAGADGDVSVFVIQLDVLFVESGQVDLEGIRLIGFGNIRLHGIYSFFFEEGAEERIERIREEIGNVIVAVIS